jgi:thiamine kinase-like enzyme
VNPAIMLKETKIVDLLANHWDLKAENIQEFEQGSSNPTWLFHSEGDQFCFVIDTAFEPIAETLALRSCLDKTLHQQFDYPRLAALKTTDGRNFIDFQGNLIFVKPFIQGQTGIFDLNVSRQVGKQLGYLHALPAPDFLFSWPRRIFLENHLRMLAEEVADESFVEGIISVETNSSSCVEEAYRKNPVWIHGDVHSHNLIVDSSKKVYLIDWGCSRVESVEYELALIWAQLLADPNCTNPEVIFQCLLENYTGYFDVSIMPFVAEYVNAFIAYRIYYRWHCFSPDRSRSADYLAFWNNQKIVASIPV